jgi:two-component system chemotaxis response regulator CheB
VQRATHLQALETGHVYLAGPAESVRVVPNGVGRMLHVDAGHAPKHPLDDLLRSAATACGARAVGVLLSGRGDDGRDGLLALRRAGGLTITQDRASSLLFDLPGCARDAGGAVECLPIDEIAERLHMLNRPERVTKC